MCPRPERLWTKGTSVESKSSTTKRAFGKSGEFTSSHLSVRPHQNWLLGCPKQKVLASQSPWANSRQSTTDARASQRVCSNKLLSFTTGTSFALVESVSEPQNGIEAWRILSKRFNPATPSKCVQLMTSIVTIKVTHQNEILGSLLKWESMVNSLARDHQEQLSEKMKIALMVRILLAALQERVHEQLDRLTSYNKVVSLVQSSSKYGSDEMDCSWVAEGSDQGYEEDSS